MKENREIIQDSLDYIEEHLKMEITVEELAYRAGFSVFYYYRIFQAEVGMPVMQYIVIRRLENAIYDIGKGSKMIDVALVYGFDTHAGFFKAFKRAYDCSPSYYLKNRKIRKPCKMVLKQEGHRMLTHKKIEQVILNWSLENEKITDMYYEGTKDRNERAFYIGEDYVLQATNHLIALKNHIDVSKSLEEAGLMAATPLKTKEGRDYIEDEEVFYVVTKRIKGKQVKACDFYAEDGEKKGYYHGEVIGQLHKVLKEYEDVICNESNLYKTVVEWAMPTTKKFMVLPDGFEEAYVEQFGKLYEKLPKQIIHRNLHPGNIILSDGKLAGFMNFELTERNVRVFDPCYATTAILSDCFVGNEELIEKWITVYKGVIDGYDNVVKLSKEEREALPYVIFSIQMIFIAYCRGLDKLSELAKTNEEMLKVLIAHKEQLR